MTEVPPSISVVIPVYNCAAYIWQALHSCATQHYRFLDIVVIDDGSNDESFQLALRFAEAHCDIAIQLIRTENRGASAARNTGLDHASGEYVMFLDADDMLSENAVQVLSDAIKTTNADAAFGAHSNYDDAHQVDTPCGRTLFYSDAYANIVRNYWFQGAALFRKTDLRWNESRVIWEGMEYLMSFLASGRTATFVESNIVKVRQHEGVDRISKRYDHFEPKMTGAFFAQQKQKLAHNGLLTLERKAALDHVLIGNAYALLKRDEISAAEELLAALSLDSIAQYDWYHIGSLGWAVKWGGATFGSRLFLHANRALGRA